MPYEAAHSCLAHTSKEAREASIEWVLKTLTCSICQFRVRVFPQSQGATRESSPAREEAESHPESPAISGAIPSVPPPSGAVSSGASGAADRRSQRSGDEDAWEMVQVCHPQQPMSARTARLLNDLTTDCVGRLGLHAIFHRVGIKTYIFFVFEQDAREWQSTLDFNVSMYSSSEATQLGYKARTFFKCVLGLALGTHAGRQECSSFARVVFLLTSALAGQTDCCVVTAVRMPHLSSQSVTGAINNGQLVWRIFAGTRMVVILTGWGRHWCRRAVESSDSIAAG